MARYGAKYIKWAEIDNEPSAALPTYKASSIQLAELVAVSDSPSFAEGKQYGDNALVEYIKEFNEADINVETTHLDNEKAAAVFGLEENGSTDVGYGEDNAPYGGLAFVTCAVVHGVRKYSGVFYPKVKMSPQGAEYNTKGDSITFANGKLSGKAMMTNAGVWKLEPKTEFTTEEAAKAWVDAKFASEK